jgi:hypothetical protein
VRLGRISGGRCAAALWCWWSQGGGQGKKQQKGGARSGLIRQARLHWKKGEGEEGRGHGFRRETVSGAGEPPRSRGGRSAPVALRGKGRRGQRERHGRWKRWQGDAWMREAGLQALGGGRRQKAHACGRESRGARGLEEEDRGPRSKKQKTQGPYCKAWTNFTPLLK